MVMLKGSKSAFQHPVLEEPRTVEGSDLRREVLYDPEVPCPEGHCFSKLDQSGCLARYGFLTRVGNRLNMQVHVSSRIKTPLRRSGNLCFNPYDCHDRLPCQLPDLESSGAAQLLPSAAGRCR